MKGVPSLILKLVALRRRGKASLHETPFEGDARQSSFRPIRTSWRGLNHVSLDTFAARLCSAALPDTMKEGDVYEKVGSDCSDVHDHLVL